MSLFLATFEFVPSIKGYKSKEKAQFALVSRLHTRTLVRITITFIKDEDFIGGESFVPLILDKLSYQGNLFAITFMQKCSSPLNEDIFR